MITAVVEKVARRAIADRREQRPPQHWGDFVLAEALIDVWEASQDRSFLQAAREIVDEYVERGPEYGGIAWQWAGIGLPALRLYQATGEAGYGDFGRANVERLLERTPRTRDGGITTNGRRPQLWIDMLHFTCPAFAAAAALLGEPRLFDAAVEQIGIYFARLGDEESGLTFHVWDEETGQRWPCLWARGNGWAALACVEALARLPGDHAGRETVASALRCQLEAVCRLQDPSGHWHTVIDRSDSYIETSAAAIFGLAITRGVRTGSLERRLLENATRAWTALQDKVSSEGRVFGVSAGTPPGDFDAYQRVPTGVEPYGTGLFLQLGVEMARL